MFRCLYLFSCYLKTILEFRLCNFVQNFVHRNLQTRVFFHFNDRTPNLLWFFFFFLLLLLNTSQDELLFSTRGLLWPKNSWCTRYICVVVMLDLRGTTVSENEFYFRFFVHLLWTPVNSWYWTSLIIQVFPLSVQVQY